MIKMKIHINNASLLFRIPNICALLIAIPHVHYSSSLDIYKKKEVNSSLQIWIILHQLNLYTSVCMINQVIRLLVTIQNNLDK